MHMPASFIHSFQLFHKNDSCENSQALAREVERSSTHRPHGWCERHDERHTAAAAAAAAGYVCAPSTIRAWHRQSWKQRQKYDEQRQWKHT